MVYNFGVRPRDCTMIIKRDIQKTIAKHSKHYPVLALTGPRQSGKTTLVKDMFKGYKYVTLEDLDVRSYATTDPKAFLDYTGHNGLIIDEAQHVPGLFSYIQSIVDKNHKPAEYVLTGSQNFILLEKITQSLAGRVAIFNLLPLSFGELSKSIQNKMNATKLMYKGLYPKLYSSNADIEFWYKNYINTYLEKDVRQIQKITDLMKFQYFMKLCAGRVGQLINFSAISNECGVSDKTVREWFSVLDASFITYFLKPHHNNLNKRLVKQPKLYFYDTGVASHLLGIQSAEQLESHYIRGPLFENLVVNELLKLRFNAGKESNLHFWRDSHGREIDILAEESHGLVPIEVKAGMTISGDFFKNIKFWESVGAYKQAYVIYNGEVEQKRSDGINVINWKKISDYFA